ncbi:MAG: hypothetical protein U0401_20190 [Anaerolineae bacterium]
MTGLAAGCLAALPSLSVAVLSPVAWLALRTVLKPIPVEAPTLTPVAPSPDGRVKSELVFMN